MSLNKSQFFTHRTLIASVAAGWVGFQLLFASRILPLDLMRLKYCHLLFALVFTFLAVPLGGVGKRRLIWKVIDYGLSLLSLISGIYLLLVYPDRIMLRTVFVDPFYITDLILGIVTIFLVLEATRRAIALPLVIVVGAFIAYAFAGPLISGRFGHAGFGLREFVEFTYFTSQGLFTVPLTVSALYVFLFLLFAAILKQTGAADFFPKFALAITGQATGGIAKAAVVGSSLMGTVQGTGSGNVAATGSVTIPLMMRTGFKPEVAGAIEAVASTGGQIMPPVMGAAAFIMAQLANVPYKTIVIIAFLPALLYYIATFATVHFDALKANIRGIRRDELPKMSEVLKEGWPFILPLVLLVSLLFTFTLEKAIFYTILSTVVVSLFRRKTMLTPKRLMDAMEETCMMAIKVAPVCAAAGIIIGVTEYTNLGLNFSGEILSFAGGGTFFLFLIAALASYVLGMGMPTSAAYITTAAVVVPSLIQAGIQPMIAHFFAFYYACVAIFTPPIATASYVAAGIAGSDPLRTAITAARIGVTALIVPFVFAYRPELLTLGPIHKIISTFVFSALALIFISAALSGHSFNKSLRIYERLALAIGSGLMFYPDYLINFIGIPFGIFLFRKGGHENGQRHATLD